MCYKRLNLLSIQLDGYVGNIEICYLLCRNKLGRSRAESRILFRISCEMVEDGLGYVEARNLRRKRVSTCPFSSSEYARSSIKFGRSQKVDLALRKAEMLAVMTAHAVGFSKSVTLIGSDDVMVECEGSLYDAAMVVSDSNLHQAVRTNLNSSNLCAKGLVSCTRIDLP